MIIAQIVVMLVTAAVASLLWGTVTAYSIALGALISIVPNAYYARKVFQHRGARAMTLIVKAIYMGEFIKLTMMGAGFALAFIYVKPLDTMALFAGFVLVHMAGIAALVNIQKRPQQ